MKCGNCKQDHETVAEVRKCYGVSAPGRVPLTEFHDGHDGQYELIQRLLTEREMTPLPAYEVAKTQLSKQEATELITHLIKDVPRPVASSQVRTGGLSKFGVPAGYYAVNSLTGNNDTDFFEVNVPEEGKWKGYTFVSRVIGGRPSVRIKGPQANHALQEIVAVGINEAKQRYGREIGRCGECNRHLTDELSRRIGIGPVCRDKIAARAG